MFLVSYVSFQLYNRIQLNLPFSEQPSFKINYLRVEKIKIENRKNLIHTYTYTQKKN